MTMTRKQLKAVRRDKDVRKRRNVRTNNMRENPARAQHQSNTYQLYHA